jgi:general secretion pathway protein N
MKRTPSRNAASSATPWGSALTGALLGGLLASGVWAPARWVSEALRQVTHQQVQLDNPRGTVWQGSAQITLSGGSGSRDAQTLPGRLHWRIEPGLTNWKLQLRADCCMDQAAQATVRVGWATRQVQLDDHLSRWPAAWLSGLGAPWNTLQAEGQLQLRTENLQLQWADGRLQMQGLAELEAQRMASRLSTLKPMGSYRVQVLGSPQSSATPQLRLSTLQGPLQLQGQGQWVGHRLHFSGEASADAGTETALSNLLNIIGRRQGTRSLLTLG